MAVEDQKTLGDISNYEPAAMYSNKNNNSQHRVTKKFLATIRKRKDQRASEQQQ